jgi:hypothetical protein
VGYIVTDTSEIGIEISILGIRIGGFYGSAQEGLTISIALFIVSGSVTFYLRDAMARGLSKELRVKYSLTSPFLFTIDKVEGDDLIFSF